MEQLTNEAILEGNKLIAAFIGLKSFEDSRYGKMYSNPVSKTGDSVFGDQGLKYHSSWDWLIPVVDKIENETIGGFPIIVNITGSGALIAINPTDPGGRKYKGKREIANTLNINYFANTDLMGHHISKIHAVWLAVVTFIKSSPILSSTPYQRG